MELGPSSEAVPKQRVVAKSVAMRNLLTIAEQIAPLDSSVLLYGGIGKREGGLRPLHTRTQQAKGQADGHGKLRSPPGKPD